MRARSITTRVISGSRLLVATRTRSMSSLFTGVTAGMRIEEGTVTISGGTQLTLTGATPTVDVGPTLTATIGVDDETNGSGSVRFEVLKDGQPVSQSPVLTGQSAALPISFDTSGATVLTFRVTDGGDGNAWDHADWATPTLTCA